MKNRPPLQRHALLPRLIVILALVVSTPCHDALAGAMTAGVPIRGWHVPIINTLKNSGINDYTLYNNGVYAKLNATTFFISLPDLLPTWNQQYWVMVRILSEKYGCFMTSKIRFGASVAFYCKDSRLIIFESFTRSGFFYFRGNQFDDEGHQLSVKNHEIIMRFPKDDLVFQ